MCCCLLDISVFDTSRQPHSLSAYSPYALLPMYELAHKSWVHLTDSSLRGLIHYIEICGLKGQRCTSVIELVHHRSRRRRRSGGWIIVVRDSVRGLERVSSRQLFRGPVGGNGTTLTQAPRRAPTRMALRPDALSQPLSRSPTPFTNTARARRTARLLRAGSRYTHIHARKGR